MSGALDSSLDVKSECQKRKRHSSTISPHCPTTPLTAPSIPRTETQPKKKSKQQDQPMNQQTTIATPGADLPRSWSQLNIDFIESITSFLPAREISYLHRTCHSWLLIADHIRTPHILFHARRSNDITDLTHSLIRRHVLEVVDEDRPLTPAELESIAVHLPRLQQLNCSIKCTEGSVLWTFPPHLKKLSLRFDLTSVLSVSDESIQNSLNEVVVGVGQLTSLEDLQMTLSDDRGNSQLPPDRTLLPINLQPLTQLVHSLTQLKLDVLLTSESILVLRQLVNLISLTIDDEEFSPEIFEELLAEPVPFKLEKFRVCRWYSYCDEDVPLLARLSSLTSFTVEDGSDLSDFSFLPRMVQLRDLSISVQNPDDHFADSLCANPFKCLTSLTLDNANIRDHELSRIFSSDHPWPVLKILHLTFLGNIKSLAFMPQLSSTLEEFALVGCGSIEPTELVHLRYFPRLRHLDLSDTFEYRPIDSETLAAINPESDSFQREWFPALKTFKHGNNTD